MQMVRSFLSQKKEGTLSQPAEMPTAQTTEGGKCPFTSVVAGAFEAPKPEPTDPMWTEEALERLQRVPSFVRSMAKAGIESFARENGHAKITGELMDQARGDLGM
jgi:hypothetical protein